MNNGGIKAAIMIVSIGLVAVGCSTIPSNTPALLDLSAERIETRSEVISQTLRTTLDEASFAKTDIEFVRQDLQKIDVSMLSAADQSIIADSIRTLMALENNLSMVQKFDAVPAESKRIFSESIAGIRLSKQVIQTEVDQKALIGDMLNLLKSGAGGGTP